MYKLLKFMGEVTVVMKDGVCIPFDPANTDYQAYLAWLELGNTPLSADSLEPADL